MAETAVQMSSQIETDYVLDQDNVEGRFGPFGFDIHNPVLMILGITIVLFVFYTLALPEQAEAVFQALFDFTTKTFDWFFLLGAYIVVIFALALIFTPYGSIRLGGKDAVPDYTYVGWLAMLFAAGTLCRRQKALAVDIPYRGSQGPLHLLIDNEALSAIGPRAIPNGIKAEGEGEWHPRKHGGPKRRLWRKIHLGIDEQTWRLGGRE